MGKKIIPFLTYGKNTITEFLQQGVLYEASGADELYISSDSREDAGREEFLKAVGELTKQVDIPIIISYYVERFEDVKKALYTGASGVAVKSRDLVRAYRGEEGSSNAGIKALQEAISRFGSEKIYLEITDRKDREAIAARARELGIQRLVLETVEEALHLEEYFQEKEMVLLIKGSLTADSIAKVLQKETVEGVITDVYQDKDLYSAKKALKDLGLPVNTYESSIPFAEMKKNSDGLLPVVVQDYKTREVLMVAYMNEEAYNLTIETGRMTYYSRSRSKLWLKGETSGHFQYVKSLTLDCDRDTLLAKVRQIGAACHTGSLSCFFEETVKKPYDDTNPLTVLDEVYDVIMDRKEHPKEGSYTNYLFDKGIDKILKKCGEEAAEIIIAAKNPDSSELKYEISDFLYHMMVLMAECGLDWKDILKELAHRR